MDTLLQDIRYGIRVLLKKRAFTLVAVLSLALGIGANTTIFTLVNAVFFEAVPVRDPARLVSVFTTDENQATAAAGTLLPVSYPNYEDFRDASDSFEGLVDVGFAGVVLTTGDEPLVLPARLVTPNYFEVLGVKPAAGSLFLPDEGDTPQEVVVLSHSLWERQFGADPSVVGSSVELGGIVYTVGGVAAPGFKGTRTLNTPDLVWLPISMRQRVLTGPVGRFFEERRALFTLVFGRLREGVSPQEAEAELQTIAAHLASEYPDANRGRSVALTPLATVAPRPDQERQFAVAGTLLMAVVGLVLLIACANVANLLLGRAADREKEIGVRLALGAARRRLVRQLLTESLILALAGGAVGLLVAAWSRGLLWSSRPPGLGLGADAVDLSLDADVLLFTLGVSLLTGIVFGLAPALQLTRPGLAETLQEGARRGSSTGSGRGVRSGLVVAEVALALVALVGSGLFLRSMQNARSVDPGFETERLAMVPVGPSAIGYDQAESQQFYRRLEERVAALGSVESAALASNGPLGQAFQRSVVPEGMEGELQTNGILTVMETVTPDYFRTLGLSLLEGRGFERADRADARPVAIVNRAAARRFWPEQSAVGRHLRLFGSDADFRIVGLVSDMSRDLALPPQPIVYLPLEQNPAPAMVLHLRTAGDPEGVIPDVRRVVRDIEPNLPLIGIETIGEALDENLWAPRMGASLLGVFGLLALALSMVGVYGIMSHSVNSRAHEIGIRIALGAHRTEVVRLVLLQGMALVGLGTGVGLLVALVVGRAVDIEVFLWEVSATDPATFVGVPAVLLLTALAAIWIPARRITRLDPVQTLRME